MTPKRDFFYVIQSLVLVVWLALCAVQDIRLRQVSNRLTLGAALLALGYLFWSGTTWLGAPAVEGGVAFVLALLFTLPGYALGRLGAGDVKLIAALGLATDYLYVLGTFIGAGLASAAWLLLAPRVWPLMNQGLRNTLQYLDPAHSARQPFVPFLLIGFCLSWFWIPLVATKNGRNGYIGPFACQAWMKVLVVDDQPLIVEELCEFLESNGYRCVPCASSQEAIERFRDDAEIGLVLCDLHMPEMDGIELVQALQHLAGKQRAFEAIMLTGRADKQDVIKALRAGIADYYQKPINLGELLEGLQRQVVALQDRQKDLDLGHLNQKLQFLSASIDDLYHDLDKVRSSPQSGLSTEAEGEVSDTDRVEIPAIFNQLSPRQLDVARLVGKGQTNYQIACELGITENTVKLYVSQVLRLTHMHNRTQLALALSPNNSAARQRVTAH
eukprot:gene936-1063_t